MEQQKPSVEERIKRILLNSNFRKQCFEHRKNIPFFNHIPEIEQIAQINISNIPINGDMFKMNVTPQDVVNEIYSFYGKLDELCPTYPLLDKVKSNLQYLTFTPNPKHMLPGETPRSSCGTELDQNGNLKREIFINLEQDIRCIFTGDHEVGHSLSKSFETGSGHKDFLMPELCPVIIDSITINLYAKDHPDKLPVLNELKRFHMINNVKKARQSILEACVVDVMVGNTTINEVMQKYGSMFSEQMVNQCLDSIEQGRFKPMFESKYIMAQVTGTALETKMQHNPQEVVSDLKNVLSADSQISFGQAANMLHLPTSQVMVKNYQDKFNELARSK